MSNSPLVNYTKISPNRSSPRNHKIDTITIHCVVGQCSVETLGNVFAPTSRQASSNYGVGVDGRIGMYVEEKDRSWCSSNAANDNRAITIEVASDTTEPYAVNSKAYAALLDLVTDICKRNGIKELIWSWNKSERVNHTNGCNMTVHRDYANKSCPGTYLYERHAQIAAEVNKRLNAGGSTGEDTSGYTKIMGASVATAEQMVSYIKSVNPSVAQSVIDMIPLYLSEGKTEGVRGDIAFAQSCLETGNFGFAGSAVTLDQNNFCGMGVTSNGLKGNSFDTPQLGIRAQIQHLKAYGSTDGLKNECIDPRFKYVTRGSAEYVEWLGQKENPKGLGWAAGAQYGPKIMSIFKSITKASSGSTPSPAPSTGLYRVRKSWDDMKSQKGAFKVLDNAKACADKNPGYSVYDESGKAVYPTSTPAPAPAPSITVPYLVEVKATDLNIRKGPGTNYATTGKYTGKGVFTIVEEKSGQGSVKGWGKLKSGAGWISLDYTTKL